jgi:hypothetical protein
MAAKKQKFSSTTSSRLKKNPLRKKTKRGSELLLYDIHFVSTTIHHELIVGGLVALRP